MSSLVSLVSLATATAIALLTKVSAGATRSPATTAPTVLTSCGPVSGAVDPVRRTTTTVYRYSHIPYAAAPTGELRWRAPVLPSCPWAGILNGSKFSPMCVQTSGGGSEDCLYANVVLPSNASSSARPVLVYFHGGNLIGGSATEFLSSAAVVATQIGGGATGGAVVVSLGYRLNTLGWLALDELAAESGSAGNYGVEDAIAGLEWVRDNIAAFGGDPTRVTVFGQSSGGTLIFALLAAPRATGLFAGAISLSGSPNITQDAAAKRAQDGAIATALGCPSGDGRLACLRALPSYTLGRATPPPWHTPGIFGWPASGLPPPDQGGNAYAGIVHVDGTVVASSFEAALTADAVPAAIIISNMAAEGDDGPGAVVRNFTGPQWAEFLNSSFVRWPGGGGQEAARALAAYAAEGRVDPQLAYDTIAADYGLTCAARALAQRAGGARSAPLYLLYNAFAPSQWAQSGHGRWPFHGLDLRVLTWGWSYEPSPAELAAADTMLRLLGDFAAHRGVMPAEWNWPRVSDSASPTLVLAAAEGWPGGGVRAEADWRAAQCSALEANGLGRLYWWCD